MFRIDWSGPLTKGRQVYAWTLAPGVAHHVNYDNGFLIGWDRWSDGRYAFYPGNQGWMS